MGQGWYILDSMWLQINEFNAVFFGGGITPQKCHTLQSLLHYDFTWAIRQQVLKWAWFLVCIIVWDQLLVFMPIGQCTASIHILYLWVKYSWADDMGQVVKNEMWASEVCFGCLTWLWTIC